MKVLLVGLGGVGQRHARNLRTILGDSVTLLAYRVRGLSQVVTAKLQADTSVNVETALGIQSFTDFDAALAERPEIAFICNPTNLHVPAALACIQAGCDVFIEKPLSHSLDGIDELIHAAEQARRIVMVGYQLRFHPCITKLREVIESGVLGHLLSVRVTVGECLPNWHPYEDYRASYAARKDLGGGVILTQIHEFDYLYSLFGPPTKVFAMGGHWSHLEVDVEDSASILMEVSYQNRSLPIHVHQDYLQSPASRQCEVIGDRGKAVLDLPALSVTLQPYGEQPVVHSYSGFDRNQLFLDELQHFLECVEKRKRPIVDLQDGLQSLRVALAAKQSIAAGTVIALKNNVAESMSV
jgi:predicted dehydrogenase